MKIGLYFGSFNPIHIGHTAIANYMIEFSELQQIWFVITPHNPFKKKKTLLDNYQRYELVCLGIENNFDKLRASNIEFNLPQPSYTIDTLTHLKEKYPKHEFSLIMGSDNLNNFHKWKNYEQILKHHHLYIYPRPNYEIKNLKFSDNHITIVNAPIMEISSSFIRDAIKNKKNIPYFVPEKSYNYIKEMHFYEK